MKLKVLSVFAAAAFLAACETAPQQADTGEAGGEQAKPAMEEQDTVTQKGVQAPDPGSQEDLVVNVGDRVFYAFDKSNLRAEARETLEKQAAWLKKYPNVTVTIEGHADERGTREYNLALGERRANSARDYLIALGVDPNRIDTISYGEERPAVLGSNEWAWSQNRRAVTVVE